MKTSRILLLIASSLFASFASCEDEENTSAVIAPWPEQDEDGIYILTDGTMDNFIESTETALVEFYAPWCTHCKELAPEYAKAAEVLKDHTYPVLLAKVDATVEHNLTARYEVGGYPTIKFFKHGKSYEYEGERNEAGIIKYMKVRANPNWKPDPEAVVALTIANFSDTIDKEKLMLVEFYAPWCGHCKKLAPKYEKAAKILKQGPEPIMLAKVDATVEDEIAREFGVSGYPTMKVFREGQPFNYKGPKDEHGIVDYMNKQRGDPAKIVDAASLKTFLLVDDISVLGFFSDENSPLLKTYQESLHDIRNDYQFGFTVDKDLMKEYAAKPGDMLVLKPERFYTKFEPKWDTFKIGEFTNPLEIMEFVLNHQFPLVGDYAGPVNKRYTEQSPLCLAFYTVDWTHEGKKGTQLWRHKIAEVAKDYKGRMRFAVADEESHQDLLKDFGLAESSEEVNIGIIADKKKYPMELMEEFDGDHIREFLDQYLEGEVPHYVKSQPIPKKNSGPVKVVVGKTFEQVVMDKSKDVMIELYAPWCGHCKKLEPVYKELAKKFKPIKDLVIAKLDATANDTPDNYKLGGYPTIYFAPTNRKHNPIKYDDNARELQDLVEFLKEKATVSLDALKDEL